MSSLNDRTKSSGSTAEVEARVSARDDGNVDQAYLFLSSVNENGLALSGADRRKLLAKIDWRIVPIMFLCYAVSFVDKVSLNYAAVMGLTNDLKLRGNDFSNTATAFFAAYLIAEIPTIFILNKVPVAKWLGANVVLWGIATACTAAAHDFSSLLTARIFLGILQAAIAPSLMLLSSQYYTKAEQGPRFAFWYCGLGVGQIVGGLASYGFQHVHKHDFQGWRLMFVVLGCVTVLIGGATVLFLPDSPMSASFLTIPERAAVLKHVETNRTGVLNRHIKPRQIQEGLLDPQLWLLALMTILATIPSGVVSTYSATLIKGLGYRTTTAALLNMPSGIISIASVLIAGYGTRSTSNRGLWYAGVCLPAILGGALMSFMSKKNEGGLLAGIYLVNCIVATFPIALQWTAANVAGSSKRTFGAALLAFAFGVGNIIGPQTFQARDAPDYYPAKITVVVSQAAAAMLAVVLTVYYRWVNTQRDRKPDGYVNNIIESEQEKWQNLTDKQDRYFRYVY
ncbi:hypothetical protein LTR78_005897 [Recurvomyces mirabilis]|uniref:Major facilitator superfamily (MFS) profile domain-containing protein n=2 Tax=Recurvomyces mirabilis TaxID=574656 RepID=A0AAE1C0M3_9PEZI|nr:hypothetical protein LTR78_005897 [Recurvomyces mirabilis]